MSCPKSSKSAKNFFVLEKLDIYLSTFLLIIIYAVMTVNDRIETLDDA